MKRSLMIIAVTCVLAGSSSAGEVPTVGAPQPSPGGTTQATSSTAPGDVPSVGYAAQISSTALSALLTVVGLLS